ncbi:bromodomain adjacent to zinc finger domain protein 2B-like isoform X2 [Phymastichus coffea]|uniref:bromodomain adjacent to zinc finger domain protein 2B-like isoform X2 n=1 Tax=Phymastichus coffea TaxID=108790 RepID=UPI00273B7D4E|nr:bromodomain adjacent to zinc finger domain protein 2B-like isoform X2 [Phymastichus coffea]
MEKENSATAGSGGSEVAAGATSSTDHLQAAEQANSLLDPSALFGAYWPRGSDAASSLFPGMQGAGYPGLGAHHLPSAYARLGGAGPGGYSSAAASPYSHGGPLGSLGVAASQAASLGMNTAAWWTMATHLATQDYLARLQGAAAGLPAFPPGAESLLPPYPPAALLNAPSHASHKSSKSKSSKNSHKNSSLSSATTAVAAAAAAAAAASSASSSTSAVTNNASSHSSSSRAAANSPVIPSSQTQQQATTTHQNTSSSTSGNSMTSASQSSSSQSNVISSDASSILGGVRLPPDTEIIKYTSSIVGPKVPGTTNRGRKKTISLDSPAVNVHSPLQQPLPPQTTSSSSQKQQQLNNSTAAQLLMDSTKYSRSRNDSSGNEYERNRDRDSLDRVEVIKLPAHSTNGSVLSVSSTYTTNNTTSNSDVDAPLNLSLKPLSTSSDSPIHASSQPLSQLSNLSQSLLASDRTSRRKPGPKPRRVPQNSLPGSANSSLAQLFAAAADSSPQRPEESDSPGQHQQQHHSAQHHKDRPRNLGRGVSKPKKNTVSLLRSNILAAQLHSSTLGHHDDKLSRSLQEKMKNKLMDITGEENMDVTSESGSNTDVLSDTDEDILDGPSAKKRKLNYNEKDLQAPLERGWKRETVIKGLGKTGSIKGDVSYYSPCGKIFRSSSELLKFLDMQNPADLTTINFSFSSRPLVGEFLQPTMGLAEAEFVRLGAQEVARRLEELRAAGSFRDVRVNNQYERDKLAYAKKLAKEEAQRHKEQARLLKEQEKSERQEAVRRERELRNQQLLEGRKRLAFTIKQKMKIIQEIERGKSKSDVARELGLASSTVATIWKNRENIAESWRNRDMMHSELDVEHAKKIVAHQPTSQKAAAALTTPIKQQQLPSESSLVPSHQQQQQSTVEMIQQAQSQSQEMLEARKKRQEEVDRIRIEEQQRKQQERELKRQQAVILKEQMYMQELTKQREMLYTVELERERRRQHMALIRALENRRKMEEREKKRLEARAERIASKEKRAEQRRMELELVEQIRKPVEDMELTDHRPLPEIKRIPGLRLSGQAFADIVMVFEFLHNFGETLGFDMESLPSLKSLQAALLNDEEAEEEMLSVMTHLLVCAIEDPGIPHPARHTTGLGQSLRQADITHANISEVLRIYLYANATGEVKALTGVCLERERDKRFADHHQNGGDNALNCSSKNAQFYEHLHNNETWRMSERLRDKPFLALNPTHKAQMLAFLCNELLQNKAVIRQIETSLETVAQLKKERFLLDTKIRKLRQLHGRKVRMEAVGVVVNKTGDTITIEKKDVDGEESNTNSTAVNTTPTPDDQHHEEETHEEEMSENESEGTQPEEEEDKNLSAEELGKKLEKLLKQSEEQLQKLNGSSKGLRAHAFGQDRYWRRYWELPCSGGIFVEAMESTEPEVLELQAELDEKYKNMPVEEKEEPISEEKDIKNNENRENEVPNDVKIEEKKVNSIKEDEKEDEVKNDHKNTAEVLKNNCISDDLKNSLIKKDVDLMDSKTNADYVKKETEMDVEMKSDEPKKDENGDEEETKRTIKAENKSVEAVANGDKFNHVNNLHNGKELNGNYITDNGTDTWFSIIPRETCDTPGTSTKQIFGVAEPTELKIPIFPPPASPSYDRCDSPAPLVLTQDEATQLEYLKVHGLPPPGEAKPVPKDLRCGWWRITEVETFNELLEHLHSRGVREKELKRTTWAMMESFLAVTGKVHVDPGNITATDMSEDGETDPSDPPKADHPDEWSEQVAIRVDAQLLEQVEALEDKVANASMQIKGWKLPPRAGTEEAEELEKLHELEKISAVEQARQRLLSLEAAIERRYLKPPLGTCAGDANLAALKAEQAAAASSTNINSSANLSTEGGSSQPSSMEETTPRGLNNWREATARAHTSAQLAMALYMLEASIAWDKSIMKAVSLNNSARKPVCVKLRNRSVSLKSATKQLVSSTQASNCQFCHSGDNEDKLLLCDSCDRGYHTYCFRPKMENIPDGDWYCHECMNKATGERNCIVCGKRVGKNLVLCELCPRAYHTDCHNPVMPKMPRGKWYCSNCHSKQPKKRNSSRKSHKGDKAGGTRDSESSDHPPASPTPSTASNTHIEDVSSSEPATPTASPRKDANYGKTLTKKQQRELAPCKILLEQLENQDDAWPFLLPVNTKQFPTYKKIIKIPMDLSTIKKKLQDCVYKSREDFCADVRQMFINCEVFNEDDSPVGKAGHGMRNFFEARWTEITGAPPPLHPQTHS